MLSPTNKKIQTNKNFHKLVSLRRRVSWSFLLVLLGSYLIYGLLSAYSPSFLARPLFSDGIVPVGIAMGYAILALTFILTLIYIWIANRYFEPLERKIIAELER